MSRLTSPPPNPSNHKSRLCCCKMSLPMFQTFCLLKFYISYFWCAVTLDTKWQTNRVKSSHLTLSPFILKTSVSIGFHVRTNKCVLGWMVMRWEESGTHSESVLEQESLSCHRSANRPKCGVGARTYSLVRILQLFSAHRIHVQPSLIVHSHWFCILGCPFDVPVEAHQSSNKEGVCLIELYN